MNMTFNRRLWGACNRPWELNPVPHSSRQRVMAIGFGTLMLHVSRICFLPNQVTSSIFSRSLLLSGAANISELLNAQACENDCVTTPGAWISHCRRGQIMAHCICGLGKLVPRNSSNPTDTKAPNPNTEVYKSLKCISIFVNFTNSLLPYLSTNVGYIIAFNSGSNFQIFTVSLSPFSCRASISFLFSFLFSFWVCVTGCTVARRNF